MIHNLTPNDKLVIIKFSEFISLYKPNIPLFQREFIEERIEHFYTKIINYVVKNNNKVTPYLNILHCVLYENKYYIVDGQHRYYAYKRYYDIYNNDFEIVFCIKDCNNIQEVKEYFIDLNNNYQLHDIILDENDMEKASQIKLYMKNKYMKHCSNSEIPRYPNINLDQFVKHFLDIYKDDLSMNIINKIEQLNNDIGEDLKMNNNTLYEQGKKKQGLYLGYIFMKTETENKRKKFPKTLRHSLWRSIFTDNMNGFCNVCFAPVNIENFHAGHIISVKYGGTDNINNLKVICSLCNLSMGSMNLNDFKNKYF